MLPPPPQHAMTALWVHYDYYGEVYDTIQYRGGRGQAATAGQQQQDKSTKSLSDRTARLLSRKLARFRTLIKWK